ncbi:MAG: hypothetical protein WC518_02410 [Patescibacteria group bacterium]
MFKHKKNEEGEVIRRSVVCGFLETLFIIVISLFLLAAGTLFPVGAGGVLAGFMAFLILLVLGVAVSGILIFGYPAYLAHNHQYREALISLGVILGVLVFIFALLILSAIIVLVFKGL